MEKQMSEIDKNSMIPIYHQLYSLLLDQIDNRLYKPHDLLPSENELAQKYQISRHTAQRSIKQLVTQGIAYRLQGKGTFVADKTITYSVTASLSYSAEIIGLKKVPQNKLTHMKEIPASALIAQKLGVEEGAPVYSIQRVRLVDDVPMSLQTSYLPKFLVPDLIEKKFEEGSLFKTVKKEYGLEIGNASEFLRTVQADAYESKLLGVHKNDPMFLLERVTKTQNGKILEYVKTILRGDKSKFLVELSNNNK
jgi:GntR family transcriptional regulator